MKSSLIDVLKKRKENLIMKREEKRRREKWALLNRLSTPWSEEELMNYNKLLHFASNGRMNRNTTELKVKLGILEVNRNIFTEDEYLECKEMLLFSFGSKSINVKEKR